MQLYYICILYATATKFCFSPNGSGEAAVSRRLRRFVRQSFIMRPEPDDLDGLNVSQHLIHNPMLDIDAPGIRAGQIADEFLIGRRILKRVFLKYRENPFCLWFQTRSPEFLCVLLGLLGENKRPVHHFNSLSHLLAGVLIPDWMDFLIPGIDVRNKVSWMACQSSLETRTAEFRLPVIWTLMWESATSSKRPYKDFRASVAVSVVIRHFLSYAISYVSLVDLSSRRRRVGTGCFVRRTAATSNR